MATALAVQTAPGAQAAPHLNATKSGRAQEMVLLLRQACPEASLRSLTSSSCPAQAPVVAELHQARAKVVSTTELVDTVVAMVTPAQANALAAQTDIAQVMPVSTVPLAPAPALSAAATSAVSTKVGSAQALNRAPSTSKTASAKVVTTSKTSTTTGPGTAPPIVTKPAPATFPGCGTKTAPAKDEGLGLIHASQAQAAGIDGKGVTVAVLSDGINPENPNFIRNKAYGTAGTPVIAQYLDYSGDGPNAPTGGGEAFGDASMIAAQGNSAYNLSKWVNPAVAGLLPKNGCWIKVVGAAPGATLLFYKVLGTAGTNVSVVDALQNAIKSGAKVVSESFGINSAPDTSMDLIRDADDAAVAAGVTVVASTGDAGPTGTIGSPSTDPGVIAAGATNDMRSFDQDDYGGFHNPVIGNGKWLDDNISSFSSGGYSQAGKIVNLVAPGNADWALCSTDTQIFSDCTDAFDGVNTGIESFGGTSEAAPLTAAGAADVIQAYAKTHGGTDPSPALVEQIMTSTATDVDSPADEQGAGLLNVLGAVKLAEALPAPAPPTTTTTTAPTTTTTSPTTTTTLPTTTTTTAPLTAVQADGAKAAAQAARPATAQALAAKVTGSPGRDAPAGTLLIGPSQISVEGLPHTEHPEQVSVTNASSLTQTVKLSTRALTTKVYDTGTRRFELDPHQPTTNTGLFRNWLNFPNVYQVEKFKVPAVSGGRLIFSSDYQDTNQTSLMHVALFEPNGTYAGFTDPQGIGDYAQTEISDPVPGTWTAFFFTEEDGIAAANTGTQGPVQWDASVWRYAPASSISPSQLVLAPGQTATAVVSVRTPGRAGDSDESVVVTAGGGGETTIPVAEVTAVPLGAQGGTFTGTLTGGNGRAGAPAQLSTYSFTVPAGETDLDTTVALSTDPLEQLTGYLIDPNGQALGYSNNYTIVPSGSSFYPKAAPGLEAWTTPYLEMDVARPQAGQWTMVLQWANPVTGNELNESFTGAVQFNQVRIKAAGLPDSASTVLYQALPHTVEVTIRNTGDTPEGYFLDPRLDQTTTKTLSNLNTALSAHKVKLPTGEGLLYLVPPGTSQLTASITRTSGIAPVSVEITHVSGDPDISAALAGPSTTSTSTLTSGSVTLTEPQVEQGLWLLEASEVGPFPATGPQTDTAAVTVTAQTQAFDTTFKSSTQDFWTKEFSFNAFRYLVPDQSVTFPVTITPTAAPGTVVSGTLYVDAFNLSSFFAFSTSDLPDADTEAALPYSYTVGKA